MKISEDRNITPYEVIIKICKELKSLNCEFNIDDLKELKEYALEYTNKNGGSEIVKNIFEVALDNYNNLKDLID